MKKLKSKLITLSILSLLLMNATCVFADTASTNSNSSSGKSIAVTPNNPIRIIDFEVEAPPVVPPVPPPVVPPAAPSVPPPVVTPVAPIKPPVKPPVVAPVPVPVKTPDPVILTGTVTGSLKTASGDAIPNIMLELHSENPLTTTTDAQGDFVFKNVPIGEHTIYLSSDHLANLLRLQSITVKANNIDQQNLAIDTLKKDGFAQAAQLSLNKDNLTQKVDLVVNFAPIPTPVIPVFPLWVFWIAIALMLLKLSVSIAHSLNLMRHRKVVL